MRSVKVANHHKINEANNKIKITKNNQVKCQQNKNRKNSKHHNNIKNNLTNNKDKQDRNQSFFQTNN